MENTILAIVLWAVLGLAGTTLIYLGTVLGSGVLGIGAAEGRVKPWVPIATFLTGIILTVTALIITVYNVILNIVTLVNGG